MVMPRFGSMFDHVGEKISTFIKVVYVDESKRDQFGSATIKSHLPSKTST